MTWKNFVSQRLIGSRRRRLATATLYGLSLAVRFTSATGEEVEIPPYSMHLTHPQVSIMTRNDAGPPYQGWASMEPQPLVLGHSVPPRSPLQRCMAP
ncbi:hypothetical protein IVA88_03890 [Bradyrhizobium sp. 149]|uniref:hypothetical protein n=1 Tax=Bradyrhizobium sp. 149 TaxID=2782624 RepID=UPI001FF94495|nr:hypothetical protein [Bradyrhizobium sp. 149]MCK1650579.1 hypothetical protein [Bradyrhizobium sp. 149]